MTATITRPTVGAQYLATTERLKNEELHRPRNLRAYVLQRRDVLGRKFVEADLLEDRHLRLAAYKYVAAYRSDDPTAFVMKMKETYRRYDGLTMSQLRGVLNSLVHELRDTNFQYPLFPPPGILITEENEAEIQAYCTAARLEYDREMAGHAARAEEN